MKAEQVRQGGPAGVIVPVLFGVLGAFIISIILLLIFSFVMTVKDLPQAAITPVACVAIGFGAFFGGFITARMKGAKGMVYGAVSGLAFFIVLWATGAIMGESVIGALLFIKVLISIGAGCVGGIGGVNFRHSKARHSY